MSPADAAALLGVAAAFDNRKPDEDAAKAWALALGDLPFYDCRDAIVQHFRTSTDWLTVAHVIAAVRRVRTKRIANAEGQLEPPAGAREGAAHRAWLADAKRRLGDGEPIEAVNPPAAVLAARDLPDMQTLVAAPVHHEEPA